MELEGLYRDIVEGSTDGFWLLDLDGNTVYANPALQAMFGYTGKEFGRLSAYDLLDEPGREQFKRHLEEAQRGERHGQDVECMYLRADGEPLWVLVSESPMRAPDGTLIGLLHRVSDYSERRRILDELTESKRQLAEGQRIARIGTWEWDVRRDQITGSEGLRLLYDIRPDFFPATYATVLESVHDDDRVAVEAAMEQALAGEDEFTFEARIEGAPGQWIWTRGRGVVHRDESGSVLAVTGTHQDITEAKLAEIALEDQVVQNTLMQAIASAANEAHTLEDVLVQAGSLVLLHDDWERARAFVPARDGSGVVPLYVRPDDRVTDDVTPEVSAMELELANHSFAANQPVWDEQRLTIAFPIRYDGDVFAVVTITSAPPLYRHELIQTMVEHVAVQLGRVVERQIAERELADARDAAMEASQQKSEFLATMSHEIRTPLNGVIGLNDLLLRTHLDADQQRLASGVQGASRALLDLINDILDFSKIEAGKLELERVDFEVRAVLDQVANVLGEAARAKGLELVVSCDPSVPGVLAGDPTRLGQVVMNLGSNAVKFTASGYVRVRATARSEGGDRTAVRIEVSDTGIGIDPARAEGLFDSFTQADTSTTRVHGGTGLGLAISREIVHALGGEIGVDSAAGQGSTFWFSAVLDRPAGVESQEDEHARTWLSGRRVLVVDGAERDRRVIGEQLDWWQVRWAGVGSADDAELALEEAIVEGDPFEAVLIDRTLSLPRRSGQILARTLRAQRAYDGVPLLLTTSTTDLDFSAVRDGGIAETLTKPVSNQALRAALLEHVAGVESHVPSTPDSSAPATARPKILVVEDNEVNQMVAVGLLDALGYDAETAGDGVEAVEMFDPGRFDAVLMDVQMPRLDGYAATRAIRERGDARRVPVLAMTAAAVEGERERCLAAGMDDFLTKPVDPDALATAMRTWLGDNEDATATAGAAGANLSA